VADLERFEIGDEVNISFDRSVVIGVERWKGGCAITVQTAGPRITVEVGAVDATVVKVGRTTSPSLSEEVDRG
jgi:ribosomal protein L21E